MVNTFDLCASSLRFGVCDVGCPNIPARSPYPMSSANKIRMFGYDVVDSMGLVLELSEISDAKPIMP